MDRRWLYNNRINEPHNHAIILESIQVQIINNQDS